ncbi:hypothetical protein K505DRAFT_197816, partial [Melanomma pulvis-pyrius CBS 109.77]
QKKAKKTRYYSGALSKEDKQALAVGEKNHNLKTWTGTDLVRFQESRLELVPRSIDNRDAVIEELNKEKERAEQYLLREDKQVSRFLGFPRMKSTPARPASTRPIIHNPQSAPSTPELRVSSAPNSPQQSTSPPVFTTEFRERVAPARNASAGDYFSHSPGRFPGRPLSQHTSRQHSLSTIRVQSPLAKEFVFQPSPDVTFDTFLEPHVSGKGEAYRGAGNAKKIDRP